MEEIEAVLRQIWRQFAADVNVDDHMVDLETPNPVAADVYYATCSGIEEQNRRRCDDLKWENKLGTCSWDKRVNMGIFGVSVVDTYNVATQYLAGEINYHVLFCDFSEEIIDNNFDSIPTRAP